MSCPARRCGTTGDAAVSVAQPPPARTQHASPPSEQHGASAGVLHTQRHTTPPPARRLLKRVSRSYRATAGRGDRFGCFLFLLPTRRATSARLSGLLDARSQVAAAWRWIDAAHARTHARTKSPPIFAPLTGPCCAAALCMLAQPTHAARGGDAVHKVRGKRSECPRVSRYSRCVSSLRLPPRKWGG